MIIEFNVTCDIIEFYKVNIAIMTTQCVQTCGLNSLVVNSNVKTYDMWEGNLRTRREI